MKRFLLLVFLAIAFAAIAGMAAVNWWRINSYAPSSNPETQRFVISKGDSASQVGNKLLKQGLIKNSLAFKFYVQLTGAQGKIQAGEYDLSANLSLYELVDRLIKGPDEIWVTIPEGLRKEEVVERFVKEFGLQGNKANIFRVEFLNESKEKEGFLFPDTYLFSKDTQASIVVVKMLDTFDMRLSEILDDIASTDLSLEEVVTLASIIERESRSNAERPIVSGILLKRLEAGWPLQADATLQYAIANSKLQTSAKGGSVSGGQNSKLDKYWAPLNKDDLETASAYNSYKFRGLPPTPIANPGLFSIKAAVYPEDTDFWFYLHDADGNIHYARTLQEHNANVRRYLGK